MAAPQIPQYPTQVSKEEARRIDRQVGKRVAIGCGSVSGLGVLALIGLVAMLGSIDGCDFDLDFHPDRTDCAESDSPLVAATADGSGQAVRRQLDRGASPNARDDEGNRPLPCAAMLGNLPAVRSLLEAGADPFLTGETGGRPIVAAVSGEGHDDGSDTELEVDFAPLDSPKRLAIVLELAKAGVPLEPALEPAIDQDRPDLMEFLLGHGADPDGDPHEPSPLTIAAVEPCGTDLEPESATVPPTTDPRECTAIIETVDVLLAHGADPDHGGRIDASDARDQLLSVVGGGDIWMLEWQRAIDAAAASTTTERRPATSTTHGPTTTEPASSTSHPGTTSTTSPEAHRALLVDEVLGDLPKRGEATPLVAAVVADHDEMVERLIKAGADPNRPAFGKVTPLWAAVALGDEETIGVLLEAGARAHPTDRLSLDPVALAEVLGDRDIATLLRAAAGD